jgi:hypothetical protein
MRPVRQREAFLPGADGLAGVKVGMVASTGGASFPAKGSHEWLAASARRAAAAGVGRADALDCPKPSPVPLAPAARVQVQSC